MSETKTKPIKALGGYNKKSPTDNLAYANAVHGGIFTHPADYPTPPIDEATLKGAIDTLSTKITAALDGGKKAHCRTQPSGASRDQDDASAWPLRRTSLQRRH